MTPAAAERVERALGAIDSAARRLPAAPAGIVLTILADLAVARSELAAALRRPAPAPPDDEHEGDFVLPDDDGEG